MSMLWVLSASRSGSLLRAVIAQLVRADAMAASAILPRAGAHRLTCQSSSPPSTRRPRQLTAAKKSGHDALFATISSAIFARHATPFSPGRTSLSERPALIAFAMSERRAQHPQSTRPACDRGSRVCAFAKRHEPKPGGCQQWSKQWLRRHNGRGRQGRRRRSSEERRKMPKDFAGLLLGQVMPAIDTATAHLLRAVPPPDLERRVPLADFALLTPQDQHWALHLA